LFGGVRPDLSFLTTLRGKTAPSPQVHQMTTVKCPININKQSLQLVQVNENDKNIYRVQFLLDTTENCTVEVFYVVQETLNDQGEPTYVSQNKNPTRVSLKRGLRQFFEQPASDYLDVTSYKEQDLLYNGDQGMYPIVIVLQSSDLEENAKPSGRVTSQITFAALIHCSDDSWAIKPIKQKIKCDNKLYVIYEIFGLENGEADGGKECVICMSEPRDTTVLPCRHMCLCSSCAEVLRHQSNKCPICRATVKSMIEIKISKPPNNELESLEEEAELIKKPKKEKTTPTAPVDEAGVEAVAAAPI